MIEVHQLLDWSLNSDGVQVYPSELDKGRGWGVYERQCSECGQQWVAVAAVGSMGIECPNCHKCELTYVWPGSEAS